MENSVVQAIETLRREMRHDLRDMRAAMQGVTELITANAKDVAKIEGGIALMDQKCATMSSKLTLLKAEIELIEADVSKLKAERQRLMGSWHALVSVALVASAVSGIVVKVWGL